METYSCTVLESRNPKSRRQQSLVPLRLGVESVLASSQFLALIVDAPQLTSTLLQPLLPLSCGVFVFVSLLSQWPLTWRQLYWMENPLYSSMSPLQQLYLLQPCFQIRSPFEVLGVRTSMHLWGNMIELLTLIKTEWGRGKKMFYSYCFAVIWLHTFSGVCFCFQVCLSVFYHTTHRVLGLFFLHSMIYCKKSFKIITCFNMIFMLCNTVFQGLHDFFQTSSLFQYTRYSLICLTV